MGFGMRISDDAQMELVRNDRFIKLTMSHAAGGETNVLIPTQVITSHISGLRVIAAHLGLPLKAEWEADYIRNVLDHDGFGRPVTPPRKHTP